MMNLPLPSVSCMQLSCAADQSQEALLFSANAAEERSDTNINEKEENKNNPGLQPNSCVLLHMLSVLKPL